MAIIHGNHFNPKLFGFKDSIPAFKEYVFFYLRNFNKKKQFHRLFQCWYHEKDDHTPCGMVINDLNKFFDHIRTHSLERPFKCTVKSCDITFSQRGNLKRHLQSHLGIKRFVCHTCSQRFTNSRNLLKHRAKLNHNEGPDL